MIKRIEGAGGKIVAEQSYSGGDTEFRPQLTTIRAASPQALFIPGFYTEVGQIAIQARDPNRLLDQQCPRRRDQRLADGIENQIRDAVTLHLRSAFPLGFLRRRNHKNPVPDRHFRFVRAVPPRTDAVRRRSRTGVPGRVRALHPRP